MKKTNVKLVLSIIAVDIVLSLIIFGVIASLISYKYSWNTKIDMTYVPQEVTLRFEGTVNDKQFISNAEDGQFDNSHWEISQSETTFTKSKRTIQISLKFINKCTSDLQIVISGIHYDSQNRFETYLTDKDNLRIDDSTIVKQADGTGTYIAFLQGGLDEYTVVTLNYYLIETTVPIEGSEQDKQNISISIDYALN